MWSFNWCDYNSEPNCTKIQSKLTDSVTWWPFRLPAFLPGEWQVIGLIPGHVTPKTLQFPLNAWPTSTLYMAGKVMICWLNNVYILLSGMWKSDRDDEDDPSWVRSSGMFFHHQLQSLYCWVQALLYGPEWYVGCGWIWVHLQSWKVILFNENLYCYVLNIEH